MEENEKGRERGTKCRNEGKGSLCVRFRVLAG